MQLKDRVRAARKKAGLTQAQLAEKTGLDQSSISNLERGKSLSSTHAYQIADACGVDAAWLITGEERQDSWRELLTMLRISQNGINEGTAEYSGQEGQNTTRVVNLLRLILTEYIAGRITDSDIDTLDVFVRALGSKGAR
ncbi:helix-turn-helix transcriptional regulator [Microbulbifer thermotolerans]|uniref:helix-turn-helix domain-containing protein n=1 Tax=Microbulbifer thermotolerans TaxID=252514 RepID=UPI002672356E|nr:helix-turn-helix transcriptional regulator [Microbulbifer thermotolerans]WKT59133.1 helix-turn-helix transcriptional regulator [Microbulbifer thermotolerans]